MKTAKSILYQPAKVVINCYYVACITVLWNITYMAENKDYYLYPSRALNASSTRVNYNFLI